MTVWQKTYNKVVSSGSKLYLLIGINVGIYLISRIAPIDSYLALPAALPGLLLHAWTLVTYMFMHADFFHILYNMLWLYWLGEIFEEYLGHSRTIGLYLLGGLAGATLYLLSYNILPFFSASVSSSFLLGASASVLAIIVAAATLVPNHKISMLIIGPVSIKWIAVLYVVLSFWGITGRNAGGEIAHLGGALFGFIYIKQLQNGNDMVALIGNMFKRQPSKLKVVSTNRDNPASGIPRQDEVDRILDKISKVGYENLSKQEKETLFRASKNEEK